jgi:hypothetical protein
MIVLAAQLLGFSGGLFSISAGFTEEYPCSKKHRAKRHGSHAPRLVELL